MGAVEKFRMSAKVTECAHAARPDCLVTTKSQAFKIHNFHVYCRKTAKNGLGSKWSEVLPLIASEVLPFIASICFNLQRSRLTLCGPVQCPARRQHAADNTPKSAPRN